MDEIQVEVKKLEDESKALKHELYKMIWYMRGSISLNEVFNMDVLDREIIAKVIQENIELSKETGLSLI
jgi:hypothetical protein